MKVSFLDLPNWIEKQGVERVFGCAFTVYPIPNIFSLQCAALLKKNKFDANYIDAATEKWSKQKFLQFLKNDESDAYVLYSVNLSTKSDLLSLHIIRSIKPTVPVIFLGPAPTYFSEQFLADENCFVVRGEPELSLLELLQAMQNKKTIAKIRGISYLGRSGVKHNKSRPPIEDLDKMPFPDRNLLKRNLYENPKLGEKPWAAMLSSRGCSYRCIYCVPNSLSFARELEFKKNNEKKPAVRMRSAANVVQEFKQLAKEGYKAVSIIDDQFVWEKERTIAICNGIKSLGIAWGCLARIDSLDDELLAAMAEAGCKYIDLGIESFNQSVLDYVKKDLNVSQIPEKVALIKKHGIDVKLNILLGACPFESKESIKKSIETAKKLKPNDIMFSIVSPFPGTEFFEQCKKNNWLVEGKYAPSDVGKKAATNFPTLKSHELEKLAKEANYGFFLSPNFVLTNAKKLFSLAGLPATIKAVKRKLTF